MISGPFLGVLYHWLGGLASASFYIPYRRVRKWSWETYWLVGGVFSWIIAPLALAAFLVPGLWGILARSSFPTLMWTYFFGVLWGIGGLTFGLTMRYLGIALGMAVALGFCAAFGTLVPPLFSGEFGQILNSEAGRLILVGVATCLVGIGVSGVAGMSKERELSPEQKSATVKEFHFSKGMLVATFSGVMSSCFAYGLASGKPIAELTARSLKDNGGSDLWQNLPVLVVVLAGGFTTNFIWCLILHFKNRSGHEYINLGSEFVAEVSAFEGVSLSAVAEDKIIRDSSMKSHDMVKQSAGQRDASSLIKNYLFSALAGITWYFQFFFYSMGQTRMGQYEFSSWTLHMASIIIFSTLWGVLLKEWSGASRRTHGLVGLGLFFLILSTVIVGYGNLLKGIPSGH